MKILVLNCGSSSIKYKLYDMQSACELAQGGIEKLGLPDSFIKFKTADGEKHVITTPLPEHSKGIELILNILTGKEYGCISSLAEIDAVGHRVAHGGSSFNRSVVITPEVIREIEACSDLAPLHNPANLKGIRAISSALPEVMQVAVFDTAFHQTMPAKAYTYAIPYEYYEKYGVRRYGFHGTSHRYVSRRAAEVLGLDYANSSIITCHLGGGGSVAAVKNGQCVDTSMGLTPVEGLIMGTRSGDVDLGAITYIMEKEGMSVAEVNQMINKRSGVLGVSGISSDMRDIEAAIEQGNQRARLAWDMFDYRLLKYIGSYIAVLGGVDAIVFTGGIGENQASTRDFIARSLAWMGVRFDAELNARSRGGEVKISTDDSTVAVAIIATDEELTIANDTLELYQNK